MTIKDSLDTAGVVTTWGVESRADHVPAHDSTVVSRLKRSGAILLGKTNTPELTLSFETNSPVFGPTNNPYDLDRTAGGSSGGAAAIVAAGGSPFDIGSDTGGSVRVPAHFCGVTGIRPTSGRVPRTGNAIGPGGLLDMLTTVGPIARYVEDLELILPLISGPDASDPSIVPVPWNKPEDAGLRGLRGAFHVDNGIRAATDETVSAVRSAVVALSDRGVHLEQARPPPIDQTLEIFLELLNWDSGAWRAFLLGRRTTETSFAGGEDIAARVAPHRIIRMIDRWDRYREEMNRFMASYDLLVCPVNAVPALPHGKVAENLDAFSYTMAYSLTGWPAVVVRAGTSAEGLPIDVQLVSRHWREDIALSAAKRVEAVSGGWRKPAEF
jgi:amidase